MKRKQRYICVCCGKIIEFWEKDFIIKRKVLFPDHDDIWESYQKVRICESCMTKMQEYIKKT